MQPIKTARKMPPEMMATRNLRLFPPSGRADLEKILED